MSDTIESKEAVHGEKMIEIKVRFWTHDLAEGKGPDHSQARMVAGVVRIDAN